MRLEHFPHELFAAMFDVQTVLYEYRIEDTTRHHLAYDSRGEASFHNLDRAALHSLLWYANTVLCYIDPITSSQA